MRLTRAFLLVWFVAVGSCAAAKVDPAGKSGAGAPGSSAPNGGGSDQGQGAMPAFVLPDAAPPSDAKMHFGDGAGCNRLDVTFTREIPTVAIVVDRSSSMFENYGNVSRWAALRTALLDPANGLVKANDKDIRFGLVMFTAVPSSTCPALEPQVAQLSFTLGAFDAISAVYGPALPPSTEKGETPTGETIAAVTEALGRVADPGPKYILLATDGEPDTCPGTCVGKQCPVPDRAAWPRNPQCGQDRSIAAVQAAFAKGIKTFVIGLGDEVGAEHLQALANAGAGLPVALSPAMMEMLTGTTCKIPAADLKAQYLPAGANAQFFAPANQKALAEAFKTVIDSVRSCKVTLTGMVQLANAAQGKVTLDGEPLRYMDPNGWQMNSATELEILGDKCQDLLHKPEAVLQIAFPCAVYNE